MADIAFYLEQAALCGQAAEAATLDNQREKFLTAQKAWQALAVRGERPLRAVLASLVPDRGRPT